MNASFPTFRRSHAEPSEPAAETYFVEKDDWIRETAQAALGVVRRRKWLGLAILLVAIGGALVYTMLQTPRYTAYSVIQVNDQAARVLGDESDLTANADAGWDVDRFLNTQLAVLESRSLADRVARALELYNDPGFLDAMESASAVAEISDQFRREMVLNLLTSNLEVAQPTTSRIFEVGFESADPETSARIANAYAEQFIQANLQTRYDSSAYAREFVAGQLEEARARLENSERELNAYARSAGLIRTRDPSASAEGESPTAAKSITEASLVQLNAAANEAAARRVAAESRWNAERGRPLMSSQVVLANPTVQALMTKRAELRSELATARERYLPDHPTVTSLEEQVASISAQLDATANGVRNAVRSEYDAALQEESRLRSQVSALRGDTLAEQDRSVRYNTLAREADTDREIYDGLLQRFRELNASAGIATSNIAIVDRADPPADPSSPNLLLNLLVGMLAGLAVGGGAMFLRDQFDDAIRQPEDVESKLGLPLLGVVPQSETDDPAADLADSKSALAEAYHSLSGTLLHATRDGLPKILAVTSAQANEGKSTTAFALASDLARMGMRTVIVDADLRRPSLHKRLAIPNSRGLAELLTTGDEPRDVVQRSDVANLDFVLSGAIPPSAASLLSSPGMAAVLEKLAAIYEAVVIDSPPVLGLADAPALAALVDGSIFVVEANRVHSGALRAALRRLRLVDANIAGVVLTKFDPSRADSYSAYYGYDYYRYQSDDSKAG